MQNNLNINCNLSNNQITLLERLVFIKNVSFNFLVKYQEYTNALCSENINFVNYYFTDIHNKYENGNFRNKLLKLPFLYLRFFL